MDEREVLAVEFTADQAKFEVSGGGFQDLGNGAKWATRRWMGKQRSVNEAPPTALSTFWWQEDNSCSIILPVRCFDTDILSIWISLCCIDYVKCISLTSLWCQKTKKQNFLSSRAATHHKWVSFHILCGLFLPAAIQHSGLFWNPYFNSLCTQMCECL